MAKENNLANFSTNFLASRRALPNSAHVRIMGTMDKVEGANARKRCPHVCAWVIACVIENQHV